MLTLPFQLPCASIDPKSSQVQIQDEREKEDTRPRVRRGVQVRARGPQVAAGQDAGHQRVGQGPGQARLHRQRAAGPGEGGRRAEALLHHGQERRHLP